MEEEMINTPEYQNGAGSPVRNIEHQHRKVVTVHGWFGKFNAYLTSISPEFLGQKTKGTVLIGLAAKQAIDRIEQILGHSIPNISPDAQVAVVHTFKADLELCLRNGIAGNCGSWSFKNECDGTKICSVSQRYKNNQIKVGDVLILKVIYSCALPLHIGVVKSVFEDRPGIFPDRMHPLNKKKRGHMSKLGRLDDEKTWAIMVDMNAGILLKSKLVADHDSSDATVESIAKEMGKKLLVYESIAMRVRRLLSTRTF
jgi:hypothetical protein